MNADRGFSGEIQEVEEALLDVAEDFTKKLKQLLGVNCRVLVKVGAKVSPQELVLLGKYTATWSNSEVAAYDRKNRLENELKNLLRTVRSKGYAIGNYAVKTIARPKYEWNVGLDNTALKARKRMLTRNASGADDDENDNLLFESVTKKKPKLKARIIDDGDDDADQNELRESVLVVCNELFDKNTNKRTVILGAASPAVSNTNILPSKTVPTVLKSALKKTTNVVPPATSPHTKGISPSEVSIAKVLKRWRQENMPDIKRRILQLYQKLVPEYHKGFPETFIEGLLQIGDCTIDLDLLYSCLENGIAPSSIGYHAILDKGIHVNSINNSNSHANANNNSPKNMNCLYDHCLNQGIFAMIDEKRFKRDVVDKLFSHPLDIMILLQCIKLNIPPSSMGLDKVFDGHLAVFTEFYT